MGPGQNVWAGGLRGIWVGGRGESEWGPRFDNHALCLNSPRGSLSCRLLTSQYLPTLLSISKYNN